MIHRSGRVGIQRIIKITDWFSPHFNLFWSSRGIILFRVACERLLLSGTVAVELLGQITESEVWLIAVDVLYKASFCR